MAQFGSALDWGSRGHGFKSRYSDQETRHKHCAEFLDLARANGEYQKLSVCTQGEPKFVQWARTK